MVRDRAARYGSREVFRYINKNKSGYSNLTWNELITETNKVSKALISFGFEYDTKIGIFSDNRIEWSISDIGVMAVRGVVVPIYATSSKQQVKYLVDETNMKLLFVGGKDQLDKAIWLLDNCESLEKIVVFESGICPNNDARCSDWANFCKLGNNDQYNNRLDELMQEASPEDLATIIYTSGTTGEPKGAMLGHDNFMFTFAIHDKRLDVCDTDVSMCFLPLSHVYERTWSYYLLYCGAINFFLENPREVINALPIAKPTLMCTVPRFFEKTYDGIQLEVSKWAGYKKTIFNWAVAVGHKYIVYECKAQKAPFFLNLQRSIAEKLVYKKLRQVFGGNIRVIPCAGAAIRPDLLKFFHAVGLFINYGYGTTETTATVSCFKSDVYEFDSCGTVMPDVNVKISEEGEILIKGNTVFRGYYLKPEETAKSIVDGWYKTGDKGHISEEGNLVMTDRIKDLFKTSVGKYISPQKLELLIGQDQFVEQIVVIGDNRKYVTALIVPSFESFKTLASMYGLDANDHEKLISNNDIKAFMKKRVDEMQEELSSYEKVVKFTLLTEPFSIENKALTNTLKIRRAIIMDMHKERIEAMYN